MKDYIRRFLIAGIMGVCVSLLFLMNVMSLDKTVKL